MQIRETWYFAFLMWADKCGLHGGNIQLGDSISNRAVKRVLLQPYQPPPIPFPPFLPPSPLPALLIPRMNLHGCKEWISSFIWPSHSVHKCLQKIALVSLKFKMWPKTRSNIQLHIFFHYWRACNEKSNRIYCKIFLRVSVDWELGSHSSFKCTSILFCTVVSSFILSSQQFLVNESPDYHKVTENYK